MKKSMFFIKRSNVKSFILIFFSLLNLVSVSSYAVINISNIVDLQKIGNDPAYPLNGEYQLTQNIDASETRDWNQGSGFQPIGDMSNYFSGKFNGNGYIITNLYIHRPNDNNVGLFGYIHGSATIEELGLENVWVFGNSDVGGLVGVNYHGSVSQCFATGFVAGTTYTGGLTGLNYGTIYQCFSTTAVSGNQTTGGLVGYNSGTIAQCYSMSQVFGNQSNGGLVGVNSSSCIISQCYSVGPVLGIQYSGGLVGKNYGTVSQSYWNIETSGQTVSDGGEGKTTVEMKKQSTYPGWDFVFFWEIIEDTTYPYIKGLGPMPTPDEPPTVEIQTLEELTKIGLDWKYPWNGKYLLVSDIDAGETVNWNNGTGFKPIPLFCGHFDGNSYIINNLYINNPNGSGAALFGNINHGGEINNVRLENVWINGMYYCGGIAGQNYGFIINCNVSGYILGAQYIGGIVGKNLGKVISSFTSCSISGDYYGGGITGFNSGSIILSNSISNIYCNYYSGGLVGLQETEGSITKCYSSGNVNGINSVGGLVGTNNDGDIENSYSVSSTSGNNKVGGLIGNNLGNVKKCYSAGAVSGNVVGGLIGEDDGSGVIEDCYWDTQTSGQGSSAGGQGKTTTEMKQQATFVNWDFPVVWSIIENTTYPYLTELWITMPPMDPITKEIWNIYDLAKIGQDWDYPWTANYTLMTDIDASETIVWNEGKGFEPIKYFAGTLEGNGHTISNLYINRPEESSQSLIKNLWAGGKIQNLNLSNIWVNGYTSTGGLVTNNNGLLKRCHVIGLISGHSNVGGLACYNSNHIELCSFRGSVAGSYMIGGISSTNNGFIVKSYSTSSVISSYHVGGITASNLGTLLNCYATEGTIVGDYSGGLVGFNYGTINKCYSTGYIQGTSNTGGLVGVGNATNISYSYWDYETSGQLSSVGGDPRDTFNMKLQSTYSGWDFTNVWGIVEGLTYPYLRELGPTQSSPSPPTINITTLDELNRIGRDWSYPSNGTYKLINDIDASDTINWNEGKGFNPISAFWGNFNGYGHTIQNLYINRPDENYVGLFRAVFKGNISSLILDSSWIKGFDYVGGLVASNYGYISNCCVSGYTIGNTQIGGMVNYNYGIMSSNCSMGYVIGNSTIGGLVSSNTGGIFECYSMASVIGETMLAGLVLENNSDIASCYSTGQVSGASSTAGFILYGDPSDVSDSYWDIETSEQTSSPGGGTGKTTAEMKQQSTYSGWDFMHRWAIIDNISYPYFLWQNGPQISCPNVVNLTKTQAESLLYKYGFTIGTETYQCSDTVPADTVISQNPQAGKIMPLGASVDLVISSGPCPEGEGTIEGTPEGSPDGEGTIEGTPEGSPDGTPEGEGIVEGSPDGSPDGEGIIEGTPEGSPDGTPEGEGIVEGSPDGSPDGEGTIEGTPEGSPDGTPEGEGTHEGHEGEGIVEGTPDGEGTVEGNPDGSPDGEGTIEGTPEGSPDGTPEGEGTIEGTPDGSPDGEGIVEGSAEGSLEGEKPPHSADPNGDWIINLSELLRVIQFFNSGGYHCALPGEESEDGYIPGLDGDKTCTPHSSDYNEQDWTISLSELLRLIQFFNFGSYHACPGVGEDGYCPGT